MWLIKKAAKKWFHKLSPEKQLLFIGLCYFIILIIVGSVVSIMNPAGDDAYVFFL